MIEGEKRVFFSFFVMYQTEVTVRGSRFLRLFGGEEIHVCSHRVIKKYGGIFR